MRTYLRNTCDVIDCDEQRFRIGTSTMGVCHKHHLETPTAARRQWLLTEIGSPEHDEACAALMDWHIKEGNACEHHKFRKDGETPSDNSARCLICYPKTARENRGFAPGR